ncbi:hypothetical protein [Rhodovulum steppense]|uniref:Uncharacterized protein n=1 Tax=Rhodovulum steppense TaxID=540251 RepID=A0A4R1YVB1_9RHOB|nr:hypothetical protein [Rhodovulum steppense]TCM85059.1 hypothetical protein EV216_109144 [Rhodovulum steppense]
MTAPDRVFPAGEVAPLALATVLGGLGHELGHAADLLRRYERAVLARESVPDERPRGARELQLVDLVIQILDDLGPLAARLADEVPPGTAIPGAVLDQLRLDQLRTLLGGPTRREAPHSGGHIDVF